MLRRHWVPVLLVVVGVFLVGSACVVRTHPGHHSRPSTVEHKKNQKKYAKKHKKQHRKQHKKND